MPVVAVLGNHDFESGQADEVREILCDAGVMMLDGEACEVRGVGFAGVKGFAGGFGRGTLAAWGEPAIKLFVHEAVDEALKLESALARLRTPHKIARPALRADPRDGRGRAGRDLPVPGLQPPGGAAQPLPRDGRLPRPRPPRHARGRTTARHPRVQRGAAAAAHASGRTGRRCASWSCPPPTSPQARPGRVRGQPPAQVSLPECRVYCQSPRRPRRRSSRNLRPSTGERCQPPRRGTAAYPPARRSWMWNTTRSPCASMSQYSGMPARW